MWNCKLKMHILLLNELHVFLQLDISNVMDKGIFEVTQQGQGEEKKGEGLYEFAISVSVAPGVFIRTKMVTLMPRFMVYNCLDNDVVIKQQGTSAFSIGLEGWLELDELHSEKLSHFSKMSCALQERKMRPAFGSAQTATDPSTGRSLTE